MTSIFAAAMPSDTRATLLLLGVIGLIYSLAWVLDFKGWTTLLLQTAYRHWGTLLWPFGSERSYVAFNRYGGWSVVVISTVFLGAGIRG
jgi:hypothetical protein